jgi:hypothetical protein
VASLPRLASPRVCTCTCACARTCGRRCTAALCQPVTAASCHNLQRLARAHACTRQASSTTCTCSCFVASKQTREAVHSRCVDVHCSCTQPHASPVVCHLSPMHVPRPVRTDRREADRRRGPTSLGSAAAITTSVRGRAVKSSGIRHGEESEGTQAHTAAEGA